MIAIETAPEPIEAPDFFSNQPSRIVCQWQLEILS